ncbi:hypothetical protein BH09PAT2_BH09PAT2_00480 [soil metagenome]
MRRIILLIAVIIVAIAVAQQVKKGKIQSFLPNLASKTQGLSMPSTEQSIVYQESVVTKVVEDSLPSVVTIGISTTSRIKDSFEISPFSPFGQKSRQERVIEQNIGSGFIISEDGLVITNKHVVLETDATYKVLTNDNKEYDVKKIYRDPLNDLAILKIDATNLKPLSIGNSSKLKLGQMAIAIGTPLGEFQNTITVGVVSGLGRGITAGSPYEGFVEKLDNVIQTDAAISAGNSGGPLLNSAGQAIGINTALASEGQNIGFAIPINIVKELIDSFKAQGGNFERPYIGITYEMVDQRTAMRMNLVEGAYVVSVVKDSPAAIAGIQEDDIIVEFDGKKVDSDDEESLTKAILKKKIGDSVNIKIYREEKNIDTTLTIEGFSE